MQLSKEQLKTINHLSGPALTLAVPGAGKTTMLLYRTMNLIDNGIDPSRIITITFSKAASIDMLKRFNILFPNFNKKLHFSTIHAFSYRIILEYSRLRGKKYSLIEESSSSKYELLSKIYCKINNKTVSEENLEKIISKISYLKNSLILPEQSKTDIPNFVEMFRMYEDYKISYGLIDFDDMITLAIDILKNDDYIKQKFKSQYDYYQLDEGQDTSIAQFELVKILSSPNNNLFVVADDDQSIYAFRGANPKYLLNLKKIYKDLKIYFMQTNYRSTKNIVNTSNLFIRSNKERFNKSIVTNNNFEEPVNIIKVLNNKEQYKFILENIEKYPDKTTAIIYRNNLSSLGIVEYLERNNKDFNIRGNKLRFFSHFVVRDILEIIAFSQDLSDINSFSKFYYKIKGYISKKHINYISSNTGKNIFMILLNYPNLPEYYRKNIFSLMEDFKNLKKLSIESSVDFVLYNLEYDNYLKEFSKKFGFSYDSLREFTQHLKYIASSEKTLDGLLGRLKHLEYLTNTTRATNSNLTLSSIHSVKGREFDIVYVVDMIEGVLPSNIDSDEGSLEEERRLFYVAMTRAKNRLYLLAPKYHNNTISQISSFLNEISNF